MTTSTHLADEVNTQPDDWRAVVSRLAGVADLLPSVGERVAMIGCGTSFYMALSYAALRESLGQGETDAWPASEPHLDRDYDRVLLLSRSGTTTEVVDVLGKLLDGGVRHSAIVATAGTPLAERAAEVILLPEVDERSVVQTRFATTVLTMLRTSLGVDVAASIGDASAVLAEDPAVCVGAALRADQVTFLGTGWTYGLALEAGLKLRESTQSWAEAYHAMEYRHGPISIAGPGRVVWALGDLPDGLAEQIAATGAHLEHRDADPLAELVRVHRLCIERSALLGLDPDAPRHLTRSIILA